jgi:hypothetical protein
MHVVQQGAGLCFPCLTASIMLLPAQLIQTSTGSAVTCEPEPFDRVTRSACHIPIDHLLLHSTRKEFTCRETLQYQSRETLLTVGFLLPLAARTLAQQDCLHKA